MKIVFETHKGQKEDVISFLSEIKEMINIIECNYDTEPYIKGNVPGGKWKIYENR